MLFSTNTTIATDREEIGLEKGLSMLIDAGFTALDLSLFKYDFAVAEDALQTAKRLRSLADSRGVVFNQSHAPFGGGYEKYTKLTAPNFPKIFEFVGILGVKNIIVHPLQNGRYYDNKEALFDENMEFYSRLAPYAKNAGIKIAIENMWQHHPKTGRIIDDTCADPLELVRYYETLADKEAFTICLDLGHVAICGREPEREIKTIGHDRLGAIHAHDVDYITDTHTLPGVSKLNYDAICRSLAEIDYMGDFTLESEGFVRNMDTVFLPVAFKFMADTARYHAEKIEQYKRELGL